MFWIFQLFFLIDLILLLQVAAAEISLQPYNLNLTAATKPVWRPLNFSTATNLKVDLLRASFQDFDWD